MPGLDFVTTSFGSGGWGGERLIFWVLLSQAGQTLEFKHHSDLKILYSCRNIYDNLGHIQGEALMLTKEAEHAMIRWQPNESRIMEAYFKNSDKNISLRRIAA